MAVMSACKVTLPGRMVLSARRELEVVHREASAPGLDPSERAALIGAAVKLRDQLSELLCLPRRPAAGGGKRPSAPTLDVSPAAPLPPPDLPA